MDVVLKVGLFSLPFLLIIFCILSIQESVNDALLYIFTLLVGAVLTFGFLFLVVLWLDWVIKL